MVGYINIELDITLPRRMMYMKILLREIHVARLHKDAMIEI
jgi:hypothetical protein